MIRLGDALWLAWRGIRGSVGRSLVLVLGLAVALLLPAFTWGLGHVAEEALVARAAATPVVVGHTGSRVELVLASLLFRGQVRDALPYATLEALAPHTRGLLVPLVVGDTAGGLPVVGTSVDYLDVRGLRVADGRRFGVVGEAVVGAEAAAAAGVRVGDTLRTDASDLYDLAGSTPLLLRVVGVLAPAGGPDDGAVFVDVKTTWAQRGLLHGHAAVTSADAVGGDGENLEASLSVFVFTEITPEQLPTFHLHGTSADWPLTAVLVFPADDRARDQLLGDLAVDDEVIGLVPRVVVTELLELVARVQQLLVVGVALVGLSTLAFVGLVASLSVQLRRAEVALLVRLGASRASVAAVLGLELLLVGVAAAVLAALGTAGGLAALRWVAGV